MNEGWMRVGRESLDDVLVFTSSMYICGLKCDGAGHVTKWQAGGAAAFENDVGIMFTWVSLWDPGD